MTFNSKEPKSALHADNLRKRNLNHDLWTPKEFEYGDSGTAYTRDHCLEVLENLATEADFALISMYTLNDRVLLEAVTEHVDVVVIVDKSQLTMTKKTKVRRILKSLELPDYLKNSWQLNYKDWGAARCVGIYSPHGKESPIFHRKSVVFCKVTASDEIEPISWVGGSTNWTIKSERNAEEVFYSHDRKIAAEMFQMFRETFMRSDPLDFKNDDVNRQK